MRTQDVSEPRILFTKEMRKTHKILIPMMLPIHFTLIAEIFRQQGYQMELLTNEGPEVAATGLKYVHNDTCYPALLVIGQMISALKSGKYDLNHTALMITQTGGGCRASNYIHLLRKALKKAGLGYIPVISLNLSGLEKNPGFHVTFKMLRQLIAAVAYGDLLMLLSNQTRPYEVSAGASDELVSVYTRKLVEQFKKGAGLAKKLMISNMTEIVKAFADLPIQKTPKIKVGIVGEIYVKYSALANNHLEQFLAEQGCEVMVPGLMGFLLFKVDNRLEDIRLYGGNRAKYKIIELLYNYFTSIEQMTTGIIRENSSFKTAASYKHIKELTAPVVGSGCKMGEGWLLTGEMLELAESGYPNIVCTQPFGCLPNHIVGKGMIRKLREIREDANIVAVDYDPGATQVNQENRIKLMLSMAKPTD